MPSLSKTKYITFRKCPKCLWLGAHKPEEQIIDASTQARFDAGTSVGNLAKGLFGNYTEVTTLTADGGLNIKAMLERTQQALVDGVENICEAAFSYNGCYCAVDILHKSGDGYAIYEVKSSTSADKEVYAQDVGYQKWVLTQCGVKVTGTFLVCINSEYVRQGDLDIHQLFSINDISEAVAVEYPQVADNCKTAIALLCNTAEPAIPIGPHCHEPYGCGFMDYCSCQAGIPKNQPTVFDLYRMPFAQKMEHWENGIVTFSDILRRKIHLTDIQQIQVACTLSDIEHSNHEGLQEFLNTLHFPIYHLDFETMQPVIPLFDGTRPYQQIPFQYSLHIEQTGDRLTHREFLGDSVSDPRRALAEQLCRDIPADACVMAYNKSFECGRLSELAEAFPDLSAHLLNIRDHIVDLLTPFQKGYCYYPAMNGSFSIKSVLPALFPNDPTLDYHNLEGAVHNGGEAMDIYPRIASMPPAEQQAARESLLRYCKLDTLAMVKVLAKLREM